MYSSLSRAYPFDPFLSFFQSTITPILFNPDISIHIYPPLILIYSFLSSTYLHLSFSIVHLYTSILFYVPPNHVNSSLSLLQSLITLIFLNPSLFIQFYPSLIHVYPSQSFVNLESCVYLFESLSSYSHSNFESVKKWGRGAFFYWCAFL